LFKKINLRFTSELILSELASLMNLYAYDINAISSLIAKRQWLLFKHDDSFDLIIYAEKYFFCQNEVYFVIKNLEWKIFGIFLFDEKGSNSIVLVRSCFVDSHGCGWNRIAKSKIVSKEANID